MKALLMAVGLVLATLQGCEPRPDPVAPGTVIYDPHNIENQQTACEAVGGTFARGGLAGAMVCFTTPRDAGKRCDTGRDCSGMCLARSNTCQPVSPLFGCHEIIQDDGRKVTLCID